MTSLVNSFVNKKVCVLTADSRMLVGILASADNQTNLVLTSTIERVIREPDDAEDSKELELGLYIIRGDNVCTVGLVDVEKDDDIDWSQVKGEPIGGIKHI